MSRYLIALKALYGLSLCLVVIGVPRLAESCDTCFTFTCEQMQHLALGCLERRSENALKIAKEHDLYLPTAEPTRQHHQLVCRDLEVARQCFVVLVGGCREEEMRSFLTKTTMEHHKAIKGICEMPDKPADFPWVPTCAASIKESADLCFDACRSSRDCSHCEFGVSCTVEASRALCSTTMDEHQWTNDSTSMLMALIRAKDGLPSHCFDNPSILEVFPNIMTELLNSQAEWLATKTEVDSRPAGSRVSAAPVAAFAGACGTFALTAAAVALLAPAVASQPARVLPLHL